MRLATRCLCVAVLVTFATCGSSSSAGVAIDAGDDFASAMTLAPGVLSVDDGLFFNGFAPDLYLGIRDEFGDIYLENDDDSPVGDSRAPGLQEVPVNPGGEIDFAITDWLDTDFAGAVQESGGYLVDVTITDESGAFLDGFLFSEFLDLGEVDDFFLSDPAWEGATYEVSVNNEIPNDVDYYRFTGLTPGEPFSVDTSDAGFGPVDTLLGLFDEAGDVLDLNDDAGSSLFSRVFGVVRASGEVVVAVTGLNDFDFLGEHGERGDYRLTLNPGDTPIEGDYDRSGSVEFTDYNRWRFDYGFGGVFVGSDGNDDGVVDAADYTIWRDAFEAASTAIPEPTAAASLLLAMVVAAAKQGRR